MTQVCHGDRCKLCKGHEKHPSSQVAWPSEDIPCFLKPLVAPAPTEISLIGWSPGVFPPACTGRQSRRAFWPFLICWLLLPAAAGACWAPGSCCFLLLLLHGSYHSESLLITKGTHGQISAPPKIGAHSYIFSPPKIIKLWEKARYVWQYLKYDIQCIRRVEKMDYEFSHSRAPG